MLKRLISNAGDALSYCFFDLSSSGRSVAVAVASPHSHTTEKTPPHQSTPHHQVFVIGGRRKNFNGLLPRQGVVVDGQSGDETNNWNLELL